jgi:excisionase family DNA binding protein
MSEILNTLIEIHQMMEKQVVNQKKILNLEEASLFLGISKSDLYKRTSTNGIPFHKPSGKLIYFLREDLENWMLSNRIESNDEISQKVASFKLKSGRN